MNLAQQYHREFFPVDMNGCVLYLPFYRYGAQAQKIWDQSGQGNHGTITGAVPATYPILSGFPLETNGTFTGSAAGWTLGAAWVYAANAVNKNADGITTLSQTEAITSGKRYKLSFWISNWTVGTVTPSCGGFTGTARGADGYYEEIFIASSTADLVFTPTNTARFTIDTVSIQEVVGYEGLGWGFNGVDNWVEIADHASLDIADNLTVLMWVYQQSPFYGYVIGKMSGVADANIAALTQTSNNMIWLANCGTVWSQIGQSVPLVERSWNFVALTYNSVIGGVAYLNGAVVGAPAGSGVLATNALPLQIGASASSPGKLILGEVLILNRVLSALEIRNYFETSRGIFGV